MTRHAEQPRRNSLANIPDIAFSDVHPGVFAAMIAAWLWFLATFWIVFGLQLEGGFMIAIGTFYMGMFFGVPAVMIRTAKAHVPHRSNRRRFTDFLRADMDTATGHMPGWEATIQMLLVPIGLALCIGGISIAVITARAATAVQVAA